MPAGISSVEITPKASPLDKSTSIICDTKPRVWISALNLSFEGLLMLVLKINLNWFGRSIASIP